MLLHAVVFVPIAAAVPHAGPGAAVAVVDGVDAEAVLLGAGVLGAHELAVFDRGPVLPLAAVLVVYGLWDASVGMRPRLEPHEAVVALAVIEGVYAVAALLHARLVRTHEVAASLGRVLLLGAALRLPGQGGAVPPTAVPAEALGGLSFEPLDSKPNTRSALESDNETRNLSTRTVVTGLVPRASCGRCRV